MNATVHVIGSAGSLRRDSHNKALLRAAAELLPPRGAPGDLGPVADPLFGDPSKGAMRWNRSHSWARGNVCKTKEKPLTIRIQRR
jgi:NAD(P)H-dependent FMN reductase